MVKAPCGRGGARMGAAYHALPTVETRPKDPGAPSTRTLPRLTTAGDQTKNQVILHVEHPTKPYQESRYPVLAERISLGDLAWSWTPIPGPTNHVIWVSLHSITLLPIITGRGVKYTHNDINDTVLHPDSGPTRMGPIPTERHQSLEVDTHTTHDRQSILGQGPVALTPRPRQSHDTTQIVCAKLTILVMIS